MKKTAVIYGGGTITHIRPHLALSAPAYGATAKLLATNLDQAFDVDLRLTRMAGGDIETNDDLREDIEKVVADPKVRVVVMTAAVCDFSAEQLRPIDCKWAANGVGKDKPRLSSTHRYSLNLTPADKLLGMIRKERKDIFLVACKTTTGATPQEQFEAAMHLLKKNSCNLVLANDLVTRVNMIVTPEMAAYAQSTNRRETLSQLMMMIISRSGLTFERTKVLDEVNLLEWSHAPEALRAVVDWLVDHGAYPPFRGVTVGHFGWMSAPGVIYSSRRKHNFTKTEDRDLVRVEMTEHGGPVAYGFKPSAGVRSQWSVLTSVTNDTGGRYDCIVHFHCPMRPGRTGIESRPQWPYECGSQECGENTAYGMRQVAPGVQAVMLDQHGPNIVFNQFVDPQVVIDFIEEYFDLTKRAGAPSDQEE